MLLCVNSRIGIQIDIEIESRIWIRIYFAAQQHWYYGLMYIFSCIAERRYLALYVDKHWYWRLIELYFWYCRLMSVFSSYSRVIVPYCWDFRLIFINCWYCCTVPGTYLHRWVYIYGWYQGLIFTAAAGNMCLCWFIFTWYRTVLFGVKRYGTYWYLLKSSLFCIYFTLLLPIYLFLSPFLPLSFPFFRLLLDFPPFLFPRHIFSHKWHRRIFSLGIVFPPRLRPIVYWLRSGYAVL